MMQALMRAFRDKLSEEMAKNRARIAEQDEEIAQFSQVVQNQN